MQSVFKHTIFSKTIHNLSKYLIALAGLLIFAPSTAQIGSRLPSEKKIVIDPVTGAEMLFLTSKAGLKDSKIYQPHNQWTADGQWIIFRLDSKNGEELDVNDV